MFHKDWFSVFGQKVSCPEEVRDMWEALPGRAFDYYNEFFEYASHILEGNVRRGYIYRMSCVLIGTLTYIEEPNNTFFTSCKRHINSIIREAKEDGHKVNEKDIPKVFNYLDLFVKECKKLKKS